MRPGYHRPRWMRWLWLYLLGVAAFAVVGLVINAGFDRGSQRPQAIPPTALPVPPWDSAAPASASPAAAGGGEGSLTGPVQVVSGAQVINGVSLGYPHSAVGAVSAADELAAQLLSTLDPDRAAAVMRLAADPLYSGAPAQAAGAVVSDRRALGLPASGPVPGGVSFLWDPVEAQMRGVTADRVTVLLLCDVTAALPGQGMRTGTAVYPVALHWAQADWKVLPPPARDYSGLTAEPGSPQAASLGWQQLIPAGG